MPGSMAAAVMDFSKDVFFREGGFLYRPTTRDGRTSLKNKLQMLSALFCMLHC